MALREDGLLRFLLADHLGSTSITTDSNGSKISELRYKPWGTTRYTSGTLPTKYTYTGQYSNMDDFGLMYYGARYYDPYLNRWTQPDTDVPESQGVQAFDRFAYVNNNPVVNKDSSGHSVDGDGDYYHPTPAPTSGDRCAASNNLAPGCSGYQSPQTTESDPDILGYNALDYVPVVSDVRSIIRGVETMSWASQQPGFWEQQQARQDWYNACYGTCHYRDALPQGQAISNGPMPNVPLVDTYSAGMGEAASGVANLGTTVATAGWAKSTTQTRSFSNGGADWHLGLQYGDEMSIFHVGNDPSRGVHIAFGSVAPRKADLHVYVYPNVYLWRPGWQSEFDIFPLPFGWRK